MHCLPFETTQLARHTVRNYCVVTDCQSVFRMLCCRPCAVVRVLLSPCAVVRVCCRPYAVLLFVCNAARNAIWCYIDLLQLTFRRLQQRQLPVVLVCCWLLLLSPLLLLLPQLLTLPAPLLLLPLLPLLLPLMLLLLQLLSNQSL